MSIALIVATNLGSQDIVVVACYARAETFTEAVASVASMVATPLAVQPSRNTD